MKNLVVCSLMVLLTLFLISCEDDNAHNIPTITMELLERGDDSFVTFPVSWRFVAGPVPDKDLVVIIGENRQSDDWFDYDRVSWYRAVKDKNVPPYYVVIGKSNRYSRIFKTYTKDIRYPSDKSLPVYINPLPSVSIVGKGIEIDTDTLVKSLPATSHGGHIIPMGHKFVRYRVGKAFGIDSRGNLITKTK